MRKKGWACLLLVSLLFGGTPAPASAEPLGETEVSQTNAGYEERLIAAGPHVEILATDPRLAVKASKVPEEIFREAVEEEGNGRVLSARHAFCASCREGAKVYLDFPEPFLVQISLTEEDLREVRNPGRLTLAYVGRTDRGRVRLDYVGGRYEKETGLFTARIEKAGNYVLTEPYDQVKLVLSPGKKEALVNGRPVTLDTAPFLLQERTMVPVRFISEAMGLRVDWNDARREVTLTNRGNSFTMAVDREIPGYGQAPVIQNGRTMVPLRFVSEQLGAYVFYDKETGEIELTAPTGKPVGF